MKILLRCLAGFLISFVPVFGAKTSVLLLAGRYDYRPAISLLVPAEVMVFQFSINSDAETFEGRLKDVQAARNTLSEWAAKNGWRIKTDQIVVVSEGYRKFSSFSSSSGELDASAKPLLIAPLNEQIDTLSLVRRMQQIAEKLSVPKKLAVTLGQFWVAVEEPEKFRAELLKKVREHIDVTSTALGSDVEVVATGLDESIMGRQIEEKVIELTLPLQATYSRKAKP